MLDVSYKLKFGKHRAKWEPRLIGVVWNGAFRSLSVYLIWIVFFFDLKEQD